MSKMKMKVKSSKLGQGASHQKTSRPVTFEISEEAYLALKDSATKEDRSVSSMIRKAVYETFFAQGASHRAV